MTGGSTRVNNLIVDGHLDLSMNAIDWNRDLRMTVSEIRKLESGMTDFPDRGNNVVSFDEMKKGRIGLCFATLIARYAKPSHPLGGWRSPEQAWAQTSAQLSWYKEMERQNYLTLIRNINELDSHLDKLHTNLSNSPLGYLLTLEGADSLVTFEHLYQRHEEGLRAIGPAHYGPGTYAYGTDSEGSIGAKGKELLTKMDELHMILDVTHLCDTSFWEAIEVFKGPVWASHSNCRSLVNHNRQFSDDQIRVLIERDAVIGMALDAWMMVPGWQRAVSHPSHTDVTLSHMVDHMDHICSIAGNANHIALGTDLDGGFGKEQCPSDIKTIADLQKVPVLLAQRGYSDRDVRGIMHQNWIRKLRTSLI